MLFLCLCSVIHVPSLSKICFFLGEENCKKNKEVKIILVTVSNMISKPPSVDGAAEPSNHTISFHSLSSAQTYRLTVYLSNRLSLLSQITSRFFFTLK